MNKILNPFEYLSTGKALGWGLAGTLFSICLLTAVSWPVEGDVSKIITILSSNLLLWLPLSLLLYVMALVLSPSASGPWISLPPTCSRCCRRSLFWEC
ncbi:MAG: hypothetical protein ACLRSE_09555 [Alistipes finegoldii]